ncbi:TolC family protein [Campylobacter upsaliensis]|uniref:TolC family protein n=1 Tax=Campylobacter upsaliensis TaxID=28080 RepID=UPI001275C590|nr:TolC family protein [Campylobacter upsaliensis]EAH6228198.1 TolC family protein [Campylobacter upsaliensis]EAH9850446.1 TolC family protein [Campylobacter upsaliensis]EAJ7827381.1 TolC family protein [Campylobacter upsaliensis]EAK0298055.1 TolC family protein [Campylobacter upsaliensis]EAK1170808.1 TolC family protein [Campylobacter upsaliensis]
MKKISFLFLILLFLSGCGAKIEPVKEVFLSEEELKKANVKSQWWQAYENANLQEFLAFVLENNKDIKVARTSLLSALARADLIDYDLYPSLAGTLGFNRMKNLHKGTNNKAYSNGLNLNYELDIYGKILDSVRAEELRAKASAYDLASLKLSVINTSLNSIFELAYFNDVKIMLENYVSNLEKMSELYALKYELGKIEELDFLNVEQSLLKARQNLLTNEQNRNLILKNLQDLLGKKEGFFYLKYFEKASLEDFKLLKPDFNIPLQSLAYRPDVRAKLNALKAAFKDYNSVQKSILPSISLGGALRGEAEEFKESFKLEILSGNVQISLPFLDYGRVRQNIKISQFAYEALLFEYEQNLQGAFNEFHLVFKDYESDLKLLSNLSLIKDKQEFITRAYLQKYELGKSELKDYLDASNALINAEQELLRARYNLFETINLYYQITSLKGEENEF